MLPHEGEILLVGLDFETTGLDTAVCRPLQIGVYIDEPRFEFNHYIKNSIYSNELAIREDWQSAAAVHRINPALIEEGTPLVLVDEMLHDALKEFTDQGYVLVMTQLSVWFDYSILNKWFPRSAALFSHRTVDPNTMYITKACVEDPNVTMTHLKEDKDSYRQYVIDHYMHGEDNLHDAFWDAKFAIMAMKHLSGWLDQWA